MTERCILKWCGNGPSDSVFLLSFPKNEEKFANWCRILKIDKSEVEKYEKAKVCSYHFKPENIKTPRSKLSDNENKTNTIVSQIINENVVEIIESDDDLNESINTEENSTLFESPQIEITKSISDAIDTEDPLGISDNDDNDIEIDYNLLEKIKDNEMDFEDNDPEDSDDDYVGDEKDEDYVGDEKDEDYVVDEKDDEDEEDDDDDVVIIEKEVNRNASISHNSSNIVTRSRSSRSQSNSIETTTPAVLSGSSKDYVACECKSNIQYTAPVKYGQVTKATNTPKSFLDDEIMKERYSEKFKNRSEHTELLKKQFQIKQNQFDEIKNRIKELKRKKFENNRIMELLRHESEFKVAMQILLNLIENDDDYGEKNSFPKEIQELSTNLYKCSPQAYNFIRENFKNAFPSPQRIKDSIKTPDVDWEDLEKLN